MKETHLVMPKATHSERLTGLEKHSDSLRVTLIMKQRAKLMGLHFEMDSHLEKLKERQINLQTEKRIEMDWRKERHWG